MLSVAPSWSVEAVHEGSAERSEWRTEQPIGTPPVRLSPEGEDWWYGRRVVDLNDGKAKRATEVDDIDRSETLFQQAGHSFYCNAASLGRRTGIP